MPTLGRYEVEVQDGYVVAARDSSGLVWASDVVVDCLFNQDGYLVYARNADGDVWVADVATDLVASLRAELAPKPTTPKVGGRPRLAAPYPRAATHLLVLGAALGPMSYTVASAHTTIDRQPTHLPFSVARALKASEPPRTAGTADALHDAARHAADVERARAAQTPRRPFADARPLAGSGGHFPWGWCTWYVSSKRYVPWQGNAIQWWAGARAMSFPEGMTPRVGAIMVTRESWFGHVAYVESVDPNGGFTVSEMNYLGFGRVSTRHFASNPRFLVGFIY